MRKKGFYLMLRPKISLTYISFSKNLFETIINSVYDVIFFDARARSSAWQSTWLLNNCRNQGVAGSNPVGPMESVVCNG